MAQNDQKTLNIGFYVSNSLIEELEDVIDYEWIKKLLLLREDFRFKIHNHDFVWYLINHTHLQWKPKNRTRISPWGSIWCCRRFEKRGRLQISCIPQSTPTKTKNVSARNCLRSKDRLEKSSPTRKSISPSTDTPNNWEKYSKNW